jgi:hypothetical protein
MSSDPTLHPDLVELAPLLGEWSGPGQGSYPTIEDFEYFETVRFEHTGKPFLTYSQRTRHARDGRALHSECGYLRPAGPGAAELVIAQPTGVVEVLTGPVSSGAGGLVVDLQSVCVGVTPTAKEVTAVHRQLRLERGVLSVTLAMAAVGQPMTHHLASALKPAAAAA